MNKEADRTLSHTPLIEKSNTYINIIHSNLTWCESERVLSAIE